MSKTYKRNVMPYSGGFTLVELDDHEVRRIDEFCERVIEHKEKESHYKRDYKSMYKRFYTGTAGELALEKLICSFNISFCNFLGSSILITPSPSVSAYCWEDSRNFI